MECIVIDKLTLFACHGVLAEERSTKAPFVVSLRITCDLVQACNNDTLEDTINYAQLCESVAHCVCTMPSCNLIEHLAWRIVQTLFDEYKAIKALWIRLDKPHAPVSYDFESIAVELSYTRDELSTIHDVMHSVALDHA